MSQDSFKGVVEKAWSTPCKEKDSIDIWQFWIRTLRRMVRGWASNEVPTLSNVKFDLVSEYNCIELEAEGRQLTEEEGRRQKQIAKELDNFGLWKR